MTARARRSKLREARLHLGLSQSQIGEQLGVTGAAIGHYETGLSWPSEVAPIRRTV
jgi:transcriptional regulator with XRE-family HTH domain